MGHGCGIGRDHVRFARTVADCGLAAGVLRIREASGTGSECLPERCEAEDVGAACGCERDIGTESGTDCGSCCKGRCR